ncbi:hypothetical protein PQR33_13395 [Paraburkholderia sediminicola]|uniref:hypothetical protein n=1 Tax=Paraburkholderia sediminicola TaxID=458836 RepID=UPI0038B85D9C
MDAEGSIVHRSKLYKELWHEPMTKVAARYGISDVGLRKICDKLDIPVPGRGYWAKLGAGRPVQQQALPPREGPSSYIRGRPGSFLRTDDERHAFNVFKRSSDYCSILHAPTSQPMTQAECEPLVRAIAESRRAASFDQRGWPYLRAGGFLTLAVSNSYQTRALLLLNALFETLAIAECPVVGGDGDAFPEAVDVDGTPFSFTLRERSKGGFIVENDMTRALPTGEFELLASIAGGRFPIRSIRDSAKWDVEPRIGRLVAAVRTFALGRKLGSLGMDSRA